MNNTGDRAPASVAENVDKVIRVESETLRPRSRSEAITDTKPPIASARSLSSSRN
jgi:hypothetical protein